MAHFSVSGDSIASVFIFVRIGFVPCKNYTLSCSFCQIAGPGYLLFVCFVARCCASYHGYLSLDPFFSIVVSLKAMQCVKLRAKGRFSYGCGFVIAPLRSVTVTFVLRELSIFLLRFDYAIELLGNSSVMLWPGAATSLSVVSKFCGILGNGQARPRLQS